MSTSINTFQNYVETKPLRTHRSSRVKGPHSQSVEFSHEVMTFPDTFIGDVSIETLTITNTGNESLLIISAETAEDFDIISVNIL